MEWPLGKSSTAEQVPGLLKDTDLRFFVVSHQTALTPQSDVNGYWVKVTAENALPLSGIAFHFARQLQANKKVPVGIIQSAWGSTKAEAWTSLETVQAEPVMQPVINEMLYQLSLPAAEQARYEQPLLDWEAKNYLQDPGITPETRAFSTVEFDDSAWPAAGLPALFSDLKFYGDGAIWFRRTFNLPDDWEQQGGVLQLGMIDDFDQVFINGKAIGQTDRTTAHHWLQPRRYAVDANLLKPGENTLAIRVFDQYGDGGFTSRAQDLLLKTGAYTLPLAGVWKYQVSIDKPAMQADWASVPVSRYGLKNRNTPAVLYNAMIAPLTHYTLQGIIWYQGESDAKQAERYRVLFPAMIRQWRQAWQQDLPFLFVQLANFDLPDDDSQQLWATLRAIQAETEKAVSGAGMVTAIDAGEADSVHPKNKQVVGQRLANLALATVYGADVAWRSPQCVRAESADEGRTVILQCEFAAGLYSKDDISGFEVAGDDGLFHAADAVIEGNTLRISSAAVAVPEAVRYAWRNNPLANVYNADGLPLRPFWLGVED
jgi:sialate O-acetylesterase